MKYLGSKQRIVKYIMQIIMEEHRKSNNTVYWEPFVGGGNSMQAADATIKIGSDSSALAIGALRAIRDGDYQGYPDNKAFTEQDYQNLVLRYRQYKKELEITPNAVPNDISGAECLMLYTASFGGKVGAGWAKDTSNRDYIAEGYRNAEKQSPLLQNVALFPAAYTESVIESYSSKPATVYCDPPYQGATGYGHKFDHSTFWSWCTKMAGEGHTIFIREQQAPDGFDCVWEKALVQQINNSRKSKQRVEKLFVPR